MKSGEITETAFCTTESQHQDGRYAYKYKDLNGETKFVYSWRLDKNDRTPAGKARDLSLRQKERQIQQDMFNQIVPNGGNLTVLELVKKYLSLKVNGSVKILL